MLFGDDDTVFFLSGIKLLLEGVDPDLPWLVTGKCFVRSEGKQELLTQVHSLQGIASVVCRSHPG